MNTNANVTNGLNTLLADATVFYQKLRHYHWNVEGRDRGRLELSVGWVA